VNQYTHPGRGRPGLQQLHLAIGRVVDDQIYPADSLKETVRLGAGIAAEPRARRRDAGARAGGAEALLRAAGRDAEGTVRVVGTNALRVAKNAPAFLRRAQSTLGFPIEVIPGREEARLIYVAWSIRCRWRATTALVVDIGGGSTEFIIGHQALRQGDGALHAGA
jgi:exopolyphosphatase/guanosine-5'-triphosphate,3'-diphosphate pyrophosphatase